MDMVDRERLWRRPPKSGDRPSVWAFRREGSADLGKEPSRMFRLRFSITETLQLRLGARSGEGTDWACDFEESIGLVSLVCREVVRLLGERGTGLSPCFFPFVLTWAPLLDRRRPLIWYECVCDCPLLRRSRGESLSFLCSVLITRFCGDMSSPDASTKLASRPRNRCERRHCCGRHSGAAGGSLWWTARLPWMRAGAVRAGWEDVRRESRHHIARQRR